MDVSITAYIHDDAQNESINLIFISDNKCIGTSLFTQNECLISAYGIGLEENKKYFDIMIKNGLFEIFGTSLIFNVNELGECLIKQNKIGKVKEFLNKKEVHFDLLKKNEFENETFILGDTEEHRKGRL